MAYRIQIREAESATDKTWHDVTEYILSTGFSVRSGFATLGSNADLGKLSLSYRTYDLATASMFGSTIKLIRVIEDDHIVFEGYSDSASTVDSTENAGLAWVKLTAYPYIKALEDVELSSDWVAYDMTVKAVAEHHSCGKDRCNRIGLILSGNIRCRTMARLIETKLGFI